MINVTWSFSILVNSRFTHNATLPQKKLFNLDIYISYFYSPVKKMCLFVTGKWYWLRPYDVQRLPALGGAHPPVGDRRAHITHSTNAWWRHANNTVGAQEYPYSSLPSHFSSFLQEPLYNNHVKPLTLSFLSQVITARKRSCGKIMFYTCLWFCSQGRGGLCSSRGVSVWGVSVTKAHPLYSGRTSSTHPTGMNSCFLPATTKLWPR